METTVRNSGSTAVSKPGVLGTCSKAGPHLGFMSHPADLGQWHHRRTTPTPTLTSISHAVGCWTPGLRDAGESGVQTQKCPSPTPLEKLRQDQWSTVAAEEMG